MAVNQIPFNLSRINILGHRLLFSAKQLSSEKYLIPVMQSRKEKNLWSLHKYDDKMNVQVCFIHVFTTKHTENKNIYGNFYIN